MTLTAALNMANICMGSGLKLFIPPALKNLNFVQRGPPFLPNGYIGKSKHASEGLIQLFSTAAYTASVKGPEKPHINKGDPGHHNSQPVKAPKEPRKDTVSDHGEKAEEKNK